MLVKHSWGKLQWINDSQKPGWPYILENVPSKRVAASRIRSFCGRWPLDYPDPSKLFVRNIHLGEISLTNLSTVQVLIRRNGLNDPDRMKAGSIVFDAAVQIVRILEDLVSSQLLPFALMRRYVLLVHIDLVERYSQTKCTGCFRRSLCSDRKHARMPIPCGRRFEA